MLNKLNEIESREADEGSVVRDITLSIPWGVTPSTSDGNMADRGAPLAITVVECRHRKELKKIAAYPKCYTLAEVFGDPEVHPPFDKETDCFDTVVAKGSTKMGNFDGAFDLDLSLRLNTIVKTFKVVAVKFICSTDRSENSLPECSAKPTKNAFDMLMGGATTRALPQKKTKRYLPLA